MVAKFIAFIVNLGLACALVVLSTNFSAHAQESAAQEGEPNESVQLSVKLRGTAVVQSVGNLSVAPAAFDTGKLVVGESSSRTVVLTHTGADDSDPISINTASLFGISADEFSMDFAGGITLYPGNTQDINLTFAPLVAGDKSAGVRLDVQGASAPHAIMISGSARDPLTSKLIAQKTTLDFGEIVLSKASSQVLTLSNDSTDPEAPPVTVSAVSISGDTPAAFSHDFAPETLGPGQSMSVVLQMQSAQEGFKSGILTVNHNGVNDAVSIEMSGEVVEPSAVPVNFSVSELNGASINRGTALQFGPDGKLYVTQMRGLILVYNVQRNGKNNYSANLVDTINVVKNVTNHNDDGQVNNGINDRLVTGLLVTGTAGNPVIYTQSSDPRFGAGPSGTDTNLDTNSGILHKLTKSGNNWNRIDLVRGLPRSEENHQGNGLVMLNGKLLSSQGGHTNMGAPSNNFAELSEYALSAAILEFDLAALGNSTYDLPTLDDQDRPGANDNNDPFGGNNGKNQAILEANGPVKIYSPGYRNAYDLVITQAGRLYTVDNGSNAGWGGEPNNNCSNAMVENGKTYFDALHYVSSRGYYGGHPNPVRGSKNNTFNPANPQSPIEGGANPVECEYDTPLMSNGAISPNDNRLTVFKASTNGLAEYTANNFGGAMKGDLIMAAFGKKIFRVQLNGSGTEITSKSELKTNLGSVPLDLIAQGDNDPFPGTIWIVDNAVSDITVLEPSDY